MLVKLVVLPKAPVPIVVTLAGMVMLERPVAWMNAWLPILATILGDTKMTAVTSEEELNAELAMPVTVFGIVAVPAHEVLPVTTFEALTVKYPLVQL
jgi:hypothetical protein